MVEPRETIVLSAALFLSCCDGWEALDGRKPIPEGQPYRLTVLSTDVCPLPEHLDAKNVTLMGYRVRLEGNLDSRVPANYFYAALITSDGERYLSTYYGCSPVLAQEPLREGQLAEGYLNFSLPPGKAPEKLVYSPELLGAKAESALTELALDASPNAAPEDGIDRGEAP